MEMLTVKKDDKQPLIGKHAKMKENKVSLEPGARPEIKIEVWLQVSLLPSCSATSQCKPLKIFDTVVTSTIYRCNLGFFPQLSALSGLQK